MSADQRRDNAASLSARVLEGEAARSVGQVERSETEVVPDEQLPGVGTEEMALGEGLRKGGPFTFAVLLGLNSLDELEAAAINVLGPDIGETFGVSDGLVTFISVSSVAFFVLGAAPMGYLADRVRRGPLVGFASVAFAAFAFLSGLAVNAFMFFWTRFFTGISKANTITVHATLLADAYPIAIRGRMYALNAAVGRVFNAASPLLVGGIAVAVGGDEGWRWAFLALSLPVLLLAGLAFAIPEPERGQWEKREILGHGLDDGGDEIPISIGAAFARIWRIETVRTMTIGLAAIGFALFPAQSIQNFFLEERFGLDAFGRGLAAAPTGLAIVLLLPWIGRKFDEIFRVAPDRALRIVGALLLPVGLLVPIQYAMPNVVLFVVFATLAGSLLGAAFSMIQPSIQGVVPFRLRGIGTAIITFFMFAVGGVGGGLVSAFLQNEFGERFAITTLTIIFMPLGGYNILKGSRAIRRDLSMVVEEIREEDRANQAIASGEDVPVIEASNIDFSYGQVQVLFDVSLSVSKGESLALLGTNGAGKSTILRVLTGLETAERGAVRLNGRLATFASPEIRAQLGVQMLPGGKGVWPSLTVEDNLRVAAFQYRSDPDDMARRIERSIERLPVLRDLLDQRAGSLSGGQQQLVALARVMLHEPEVLIIDELSLGLAPAVVADLLEHIDALRSAGQTMIIVEQSLNVALAVADRAIFLEKGQLKFEGPVAELVERDDLARAVFLGAEAT